MDSKGIEPFTETLQRSLAPKEHVSPCPVESRTQKPYARYTHHTSRGVLFWELTQIFAILFLKVLWDRAESNCRSTRCKRAALTAWPRSQDALPDFYRLLIILESNESSELSVKSILMHKHIKHRSTFKVIV